MRKIGIIFLVAVIAIFVVVGISLLPSLVKIETRPTAVEAKPPMTEIEDQRTRRPEVNIHPRLAEIINTSKQQAAERAALDARLENFRKETGFTCVNVNGSNCEKFLTKITMEPDIIVALKAISGAGVKIHVYPELYGREKAFINEYGWLVIQESMEMGQLKKFLGIKPNK